MTQSAPNPVGTALPIEALADAFSMVAALISASPAISADAVAAVHHGLRSAFRLDSFPAAPNSRETGAERSDQREAQRRASIATPVNTTAAPAPVSAAVLAPDPARATPAPALAAPATRPV